MTRQSFQIARRLFQGPSSLWQLIEGCDGPIVRMYEACQKLVEEGSVRNDEGTFSLTEQGRQRLAAAGYAGFDEVFARYREIVQNVPGVKTEYFQQRVQPRDLFRRLRFMYERGDVAGRNALINRLVEYQNKKGHPITVVFDGGKSDWIDEGRDKAGSVNILYSRFGERADDVIKRLAADVSGELIVVSSDREISSYVIGLGKTPLSSPDFETILNKTLSPAPRKIPATDKDSDQGERAKKKGPARRLPRAKRREQKKIGKLV